MKSLHDAGPASTAQQDPAVPAPADAARTWVTAGRDIEHDAWRALYTALYPPPRPQIGGHLAVVPDAPREHPRRTA